MINKSFRKEQVPTELLHEKHNNTSKLIKGREERSLSRIMDYYIFLKRTFSNQHD